MEQEWIMVESSIFSFAIMPFATQGDVNGTGSGSLFRHVYSILCCERLAFSTTFDFM